MAGITATNENGCLRLYRTFSFRDANNKPQRVRKSIGKVDPNTGLPIFNDFFKSLLLKQNIGIDQVTNINYHDLPKIVNLGFCSKEELINKTYRNKITDYADYNGIDNVVSSTSVNKIGDNALNITSIVENGSFDGYDRVVTINTAENVTYNIVESNFSVKNIGQKYILGVIVTDSGLLNILKDVFPNIWDKILTLAYYLVSDNSAIMYCHDWVEDNETFLATNCMQSQRISELFVQIKKEQIMNFWDLWTQLRKENEYLALDITSISSYSNLISEFEYGHNRDNEKLPQINLCMLFGEKSALPVFSSFYPGSLNDVTVLRSFLDQLAMYGDYKYNLVMDKGFYSLQNIKYMLKKYNEYKFMIAVPFTTSISRVILEEGPSKLEENLSFIFNNDTIMGYSFIDNIDNDNKVKYHVIYNEYKYNDAKKCLKDKAIRLRNEALDNPIKYINEKEHKKYLIFKKQDDGSYNITLNINRILYEIRKIGWLIIVTNDINSTYKDALSIYRSKDVVEKSFNHLKNSLSLKRLHVHSSNMLNGKIFVSMISLILSSYIHNVMVKNGLDDKYTINGLINKLNTLKVVKSATKSSITPLTKDVKNILNAFGIKIKFNT
jgi:transposase